MDLENKVVWIPDSKTPNGVAEAPLTDLAVGALRDQMQLAGNSSYLSPSEGDAKVFKKYSHMKREALQKLTRAANESAGVLGQAR